MASVSLFVFLVLSLLMLLLSAEEKGKRGRPSCLPFQYCENLGDIYFPFTKSPHPFCGLLKVECDPDEKRPTIHFRVPGSERPYEVINISYTTQQISIRDPWFSEDGDTNNCNYLDKFASTNSPFISFKLNTTNQRLFKCNHTPDSTSHKEKLNLSAEFVLEWHVSDDCSRCDDKGGLCNHDLDGNFYCHLDQKENKNNNKVVILLAVGCAVFFKSTLFFIIWHLYKKKYPSSNLLARNTYSDPSSRSEVEGWSIYFGVPVFSYNELEKATNNFHVEKELGNGGFGTVYHGKLQDGREVAVKRLYRPNYRRVEQFINEVEILTRLRHKNLVSLYGCTSRHSRELLLVYEYIPNGTVADHIHGHQATPGSLTWPTRMSIAIETASALAYLHASDIIHRDVKTNNILLDDNFCVKVADFGLSRLFPNDVSHVSTAPQGTPGYVDPEYRQCYQLTSKSDVYSFGVVLMELISSLPAVDVFRHNHEINLAKLAVNKIEKCAFHELIDPYLGFESDEGIRTMTILVAKLAFQCLQQDKEMRPSMDEVLEALKKIQSGKDAHEDQEMAYDDAGILNVQKPASPDHDEVHVLRNKRLPLLPEDVTDFWTSRSTTPNVRSTF
ncbi:LEAF RUST 10 DISEASE-RESISTANCE LOCUS RECEPTOR-LIKE PROTEIN KINASE-like 1.1 [Quercus lobata]|uniref:Protein kinase domain-containing protein n=1 Tax=Quercus lobata TaxID=97700 RepID=A0A7N2KLK3_QUELO|nr:LEAF RUST 10 DISEASE-RESISTANCE LOCUS RECEPTOR-LIKE PROTEIN KINASE-like 1.1 [Quercus lobata]